MARVLDSIVARKEHDEMAALLDAMRLYVQFGAQQESGLASSDGTKMENQLFLELNEAGIEAQNAAAKTVKRLQIVSGTGVHCGGCGRRNDNFLLRRKARAEHVLDGQRQCMKNG